MISASVVGLEALREKLDKLIKAQDTTEILDESQAILLNRIRTRFLAETDPDGVPWPPSKAGVKRRSKGGTGTLFRTGKLFHSIQAHTVGPQERAISTDVPYGLFHQFGTATLPKRAFLGFSEEDLSVVEARVVQRVMEALA